MAFKSEDIYTASGNAKLFNAWTPYVSKFDTSSFYNWEQDNLPLYDLEERTYELWEQQGWPTSSVPGLALTVSADADAVSLAAESTLFTDVSSAIAAIPKVVRFPVLVEVGSFDELGPLELHNFRIEEGGSIEIINRNFGRFYNTSAIARSSLASPAYNTTHTLFQQVSSLDLENTLTDTSCIHLGIPVFSAISDVRFNGAGVKKGGLFAYPKFSNKEGVLTVSIDEVYRAGANQYAALSYEDTAATTHSDNSLSAYDISATSDLDSTILTRTQISVDDPITGNLYGNDLTKISVKNCDGPIYIRNFFVNGTRNNPDYGIEITNSDVVLENCSVARAKRAGFKFNNSKVVLSRSAFSYRNYDLTTTTTREAKVGAGFHAVNSEVTVSSNIATVGASDGAKDYGASGNDVAFVASRNYAGFILDNSKLVGGFGRTTVTSPGTGGIVAAEANWGPGMLLKNAEVDLSGLIEVYFNDIGVESHNSIMRTQNFCAESQQNEGYLGKNSEFLLDSDSTPGTAGQSDRAQILFNKNRQHIVAKNNTDFSFKIKDSIPSKYGNCLFASSHGAEIWGAAGDAAAARNMLPSILIEGGSNLELINPKITVNDQDGLGAAIYGAAIKAIRNSSARLFGTSTGCTFIGSPLAEQNVAALYANNSVIGLHGPTVIGNFGIDVLVENNSTLNITPPTVKDERGYAASAFELGDGANHTSVELHSTRACLVADNNSTINLVDLGDFEANWGRTDTGVGVLANLTDFFERESNVSGLIYKGSLQFYPNPADPTVLNDNGLDAITAITGELAISNSFPTFTTTDTYLNTFIVDDTPVLGSHNTVGRGLVSKGGVCVRVLGGSIINSHNVHFPSGNEGGFLDGTIYNVSGSDCDKLMIWNIADTSRMNASYLSVSGSYPTDAAYHGPSALWVSSSVQGTNDPAYVIASGAPDGTPDTGPLSILDAFGAGSSLQWGTTRGIDVNSPFDRYGALAGTAAYNDKYKGAQIVVSSTESLFYGIDASSANTGPFRIYWSVSPAAKVLATDVSGYAYGGNNTANFSGVVGPAYQIFSQGYNLSAEASALNLVGGTNASSVFPQLLKQSRDTDSDGFPDAYATSGFYYCSEFVESNPTQCMLDESAAATFANSKNASLGSSGRPKKVTIYKAEADDVGNRGSEAYQGDSEVTIGFRSANVFDLRRFN